MPELKISDERKNQIRRFVGRTLDIATSPVPLAIATVLFIEKSPFWINAVPALAIGLITIAKSVWTAGGNVQSYGLKKVVQEPSFIHEDCYLPGSNNELRRAITHHLDRWLGWNEDLGKKFALLRSRKMVNEGETGPEFNRGARFLYVLGNAIPASLKFALITAAAEVVYSPQWIPLPFFK